MNSKNIKRSAKKLKEISQKYGYEIKHCHALEILSQMENNTNWHVSSKESLITDKEEGKLEKPLSITGKP